MSASGCILLPPKPDVCQSCATKHDPGMPHNQQSLYWQYHFYGQHGRWPTWADAMAHCSKGMREFWIRELGARGVTVTPPGKPNASRSASMKALSIRQPWAWLIIHAEPLFRKDIENRNRRTSFRGRFLVHAAKGMTRCEYKNGLDFASHCGVENVPSFEELERGGIIGSSELVDCVADHPSPWFEGPYGYVLRDSRPLPFVRVVGQLGFFDVEYGGAAL